MHEVKLLEKCLPFLDGNGALRGVGGALVHLDLALKLCGCGLPCSMSASPCGGGKTTRLMQGASAGTCSGRPLWPAKKERHGCKQHPAASSTSANSAWRSYAFPERSD